MVYSCGAKFTATLVMQTRQCLMASGDARRFREWAAAILIVTGVFVITLMPRRHAGVKGVNPQISHQPVRLPPEALALIMPHSIRLDPMDGIEPAERLNFFKMRSYQQRVLRDLRSGPDSMPDASR